MTSRTEFPATFAVAGLPSAVTIHEVGPRDGLQNEPTIVPTADKVAFIKRLVAAGLEIVETTSFVRPDRVPQLADAEAVVVGAGRHVGVRHPALVGNRRGLERALAAGVTHIAIFASATEAFAQRNLNLGLEASLSAFMPLVTQARAQGVDVRAYLSMCFGDPWEGPVPVETVAQIGCRLLDLGCSQLSLGDTIGVATPGHVRALLDALDRRGAGVDVLAVHFHDTYGQALANTLAALQCGISVVDASAGGIGGCPFAGSATGNLATEDLVYLLDGVGVTTGVDLDALVATSQWMAGVLGRPSPSRVVQARTTATGKESR